MDTFPTFTLNSTQTLTYKWQKCWRAHISSHDNQAAAFASCLAFAFAFALSYHFMSCHIISCHVNSCHVDSCHVISCPVISPCLVLSMQVWRLKTMATRTSNRLWAAYDAMHRQQQPKKTYDELICVDISTHDLVLVLVLDVVLVLRFWRWSWCWF